MKSCSPEIWVIVCTPVGVVIYENNTIKDFRKGRLYGGYLHVIMLVDNIPFLYGKI